MEDVRVMKHIEDLVAEEDKLYATERLSDEEVKRLHEIKIELDRYWDFLRQRRALRDAGQNPAAAHIRDAKTVENYKE
ncbi:MAG: DUF2630 family protein [Bacteroidia bacterium]